MKNCFMLISFLISLVAASKGFAFSPESGECRNNSIISSVPVRVLIRATSADNYTVWYQVGNDSPRFISDVESFDEAGSDDPVDFTVGFRDKFGFRLSYASTPGVTVGWTLLAPGVKSFHLVCKF